jgi:multiple sugar transport system substrate-binding protein
MDPERVAAFTKGIGEYFSANNPFYSGKVAMIAEGEWQVTFIPKYAPGLEWGVAPLPQPEGVRPLGYSPACIADVVPSTARNPEAAKVYLRWFYTPRPETGVSPASDFAHAIHNIPPRKEEAMQERFMGHPKFRVYVEQLLDQKVISYPNMPVAQFYNDQWERQRERVVFRKVSPEEAVREIEEAVNRELDRVRDLQRRREEGGVS